MQDLDWYLDLGGKKSGPFAVEDLIAQYKNGEIPTSAYVTAQRMKGEWVRITDLAEAYRDLFQLNDGPSLSPRPQGSIPPAPQTRTNIPRPPTSSSFSSPLAPDSPDGEAPPKEHTSPSLERPNSSRFQAPPRPTEQLEASKAITLNPPGAGSGNPDATESLFAAIQAIREKNHMKTHLPAGRDSWGELSRPKRPLPPQSSLYLVLIGILAVAAYATYEIVISRKQAVEEATAKAKTPPPPQSTPSATAQSNTASHSKLLNDAHTAGSGNHTVSPPVRTQKFNSSAGGNIRLSAPKRNDDVDDNDSPPEAHDEDESDDGPEPIEEPDLEGRNTGPNGVNGVPGQPSDGSYSVDGGEDDEVNGIKRPPHPGENAVDPNTGLPIPPQNQ